MPIYEYHCDNCNRDFSVKMSMAEHERQGITCPGCNQSRVVPQYASFFAKTSKKS